MPDSLSPTAELSTVPGIVFADLLGTTARTDVKAGGDFFDKHVVQSMHVKALLDATNILMACPRFADVQAAVVSDCVFAYCPNPLLAVEFAGALAFKSLQDGALLRGGVEIGEIWLPESDYSPPENDRLVVFPAMGCGVTGATLAEASLKGCAGVRVAVGPDFVHWVADAEGDSNPNIRRMAENIKRLFAPKDKPWVREQQLLWMERNLLLSIQNESSMRNVWFSVEELLKNMIDCPTYETDDSKGNKAWNETILQLQKYLEIEQSGFFDQ